LGETVIVLVVIIGAGMLLGINIGALLRIVIREEDYSDVIKALSAIALAIALYGLAF
jgi:NhaP-type Na+/H+ or K+/H+ antiporter